MYEFKHIVVDGWNAVHSHPQLKKLLAQESPDAARAQLAAMLAPIHDFGGARVTIVYDGSGDEISIVRPNEILTFSEVFTPSFLTADELIEQLCSTSKNPDRILVVTRDNLLRLTASSFGSLSIAPDKIFEWSESSASALKTVARTNNRNTERAWKNTNPFADLDTLAIDLGEVVKRSELVSKHLKKRARRFAVLAAKNGAVDKKIEGAGVEKNPEKTSEKSLEKSSVKSGDKSDSSSLSSQSSRPDSPAANRSGVAVKLPKSPAKASKKSVKSFDDLKKISDDIAPKSSMFSRAKVKYYFGESGASGKGAEKFSRKPKRNRG